MPRACVTFERGDDDAFRPVTVYLATPHRLFGRTLPGDPRRAKSLEDTLERSRPPRLPDGTTGTFEDWIGWAVGDDAAEWPGHLGNGHTTWAVEVVPTATVGELYEREVARGATPDGTPADGTPAHGQAVSPP